MRIRQKGAAPADPVALLAEEAVAAAIASGPDPVPAYLCRVRAAGLDKAALSRLLDLIPDEAGGHVGERYKRINAGVERILLHGSGA